MDSLRGEEDLKAFLEEELERVSETEVLDGEEIRRIRELLDGGMVEAPEEEQETEEHSTEERSYDVESLLELLASVKPKQLKKLLRGATIHIRIELPGEEA
jgi:ABC-type Zn2+ transport system substrate-binding protein/surface adhesin